MDNLLDCIQPYLFKDNLEEYKVLLSIGHRIGEGHMVEVQANTRRIDL